MKIVLFTIKWAKIFSLLQFSQSQSVWWPYIDSVCRCYCRAGPEHTLTYVFVYRMHVCLPLAKKLAFHELFNDALSTEVLENDGRDLPRLI